MNRSRIELICDHLVRALGLRAAKLALREHLLTRPVEELAAAWYHWPLFAHELQIIPQGNWRSCGLMGGRAAGKTRAVVEYLIDEVIAGRARRILLVGQNIQKCVEILVNGESGILARTPFWLGVEWHPSTLTLHFGNGAIANVYGAVEAENLRGQQNDLAICTEISHWQKSTGQAALKNLRRGLRLGKAQMLWDSTPRRRDALLAGLLAEHERSPEKHLLIRGTTADNRLNLSTAAFDEYDATKDSPDARQEFWGEPSNELENAIFTEADLNRPPLVQPPSYEHRILSVDPSSAGPKYGDGVGIIELGLSHGTVYVLANLSGRHDINYWIDLVIDRYFVSRCDRIRIEANHRSETWQKHFSDAAAARGLQFHVVADDAPTRHEPGAINFQAHFTGNARSKAERAMEAANCLKLGKVTFVEGALGDLKDELANFDGHEGGRDDACDAFSSGVTFLLRYAGPDPAANLRGIQQVQQALNEKVPDYRFTELQAVRGALHARDVIGGGGWGHRGGI